MSNLGNKLKIKFGLGHEPKVEEVEKWLIRTEYYLKNGDAENVSGERAAKDIFEDYNTWIYRSQADTITALLAQAREKIKNTNGK